MPEKKVTLGQAIDKVIEALDSLEPVARKTAIAAACSHLGIEVGNLAEALAGKPPDQRGNKATTDPKMPRDTGPQKVIDIRTFKEQKQPKSARQMACVIAFYLRELAPAIEQRDTVTTKELEKYFKQAQFKLPKTMAQILPDAKSAGYFEAAPGKGEYFLNAVGYNLVAHNLPSHKGE